MDRYFQQPTVPPKESACGPNSKRIRADKNVEDLETDPGLRPPISSYHPSDQDTVRRFYLLKGPCQPRGHDFPKTEDRRHFNENWFNEFPSWLEYSISKDAAFCLNCYLFRKSNGDEALSHRGFTNWEKKDKLRTHVGGFDSEHNKAYKKGRDLLKQNQSIQTFISKQSDKARRDNQIRLTASIRCVRLLLQQGLAFRGHDESETSSNQGNFLALLRHTAYHNESIDEVVLGNAPKSNKLIAPSIQKDIVNAVATETTNIILKELRGTLFSILVDESRDVSIREQMAVIVRYVDYRGCVIERFLAIVHVKETTAVSLKDAIDLLLSKHELSISNLRGQGYDGASNVQGEFNGLKTLILRENASAYFIHCFAHQLQLALVAVAKNHVQVALLFDIISSVVNTVGGSCKRRDILREKQAAKIIEALLEGELESGQGLNQETNLKRSGDTRWGSHYDTLINLILMFSSVIDVLEVVKVDGYAREQRGQASALLDSIQSFDFVLNMHLTKYSLGITNILSKALQRKDQDIVNAMNLVSIAKSRLQYFRDNGWDTLFEEVYLFCDKHDIDIPKMEDNFVARGRSRRGAETITNLQHYRVGLVYTCIDWQLQELDNRFNEVNTELLICLSCLSPGDLFSAFNKEKLIRFAKFYPADFSEMDLALLDDELDTYMWDVSSDSDFLERNGISDLAKKMVETKRDTVYPLVYLLIKLALILPVATATVERAFSAMHIIKSRLRNRMEDQWLNDCLVTYIERDIFNSVTDELIIQRFQKTKTRRGQV